MKSERSKIFYCIWGNVLHLVLAAGCYVLREVGQLETTWIQIAMLVVNMLCWLLIGVVGCLGSEDRRYNGGFGLSVIALAPILLMWAAAIVLSHMQLPSGAGWPLFYFLGAPLQFYSRPGMLLTRFIFFENGYYIFVLHYALVFLCINCGYAYAASLHRTKRGKKVRVVRKKVAEKKAA